MGYLLITGHPRSGTGYMAKLFSANGYDIGHESLGRNGISAWQFATPINHTIWAVDLHRKDFEFETVIHVIREPLKCVSSVVCTEQHSESYRARYVNLIGNVFERAVLSVSGWNKLIQSQLPTYTVPLEHAAEIFGFKDVEITNSRNHPFLEEKQLQELISPDIYAVYLEMLTQYQWLCAMSSPITLA
ncbi:MAG: hypothetical protein GYA55_04385 [SAR324 cluster bacterium]|uniref:Sulfotransferase family protein n=1 Tax=SAR324 cluster bacterium TaxID=2024889 RepID=A0A7X9IKX3_9DELT|nr:hypothetical protein [SAR324 cluster bacterium]